MKFRPIHAAIAALTLAAPSAASAQGAYVNIFAGMAVLDATETIGGVKLVDLGGDVAIGGGRAGWGYRWPSGIYIGAEAEAWAGSGRARAVVNGDAYSFDVNGGAGAFARAGWMPHGSGSLFFVRGGAQAIFTNHGTQYVPAIGVGAEIPISGAWAARLDLTYAWDDREFYQGTAGVVFRFGGGRP